MSGLEFLIGLVSIIIIDLVVSGDNAMVIALASRNLPDEQRKKAILWGTLGAVGLRIVLTVLAVYLLQVPLLKAIGGVFLIWVAIKLLVDNTSDDEASIQSPASFGKAIRTIILADLVLSLDNIFAVAAAGEGHIVLVLIGLAISIPIIVWGSTVILKLINRFPILIYAGAAVLGWTAGKMLVSDKVIDDFLTHDVYDWIVPLVVTLAVVGLGKWLSGRAKQAVRA
ncbi:TerC family protein [Tumebacillus permanentifrigoris]|uniref:YjbE family integral membrane protein n=1 Tax=Tumebacillus permanentifrigoris TaxID=378543 RepID=A0A316D4W1_9BACL|nr:TerC family protein [Tumebacillus permanentifrigoris]PWK05393.1 YjbE family integral membrane protein [Tumebacillus permanentifrigoris]